MLLTRRLKVSCTRQRPRHTSTQKWANATDGDAYHRSAVARDRDRLRQEVLEKLGWKIHRIWSTDWIRDRKGALQRLIERVEQLQRGGTGSGGTGSSGPESAGSAGSAAPGRQTRETALAPLRIENATDPYLGNPA